MELIVLTPEDLLEDETEIVNKMFENGLRRLHIRKPTFTADDYRSYIALIDRNHHKRLVIHDHFELFREFRLDGVHLNSATRKDEVVWARLNELDIRHDAISTSFHSWQEIEENEFRYRYAFISPVFDSISKTGYKADIDLEGAARTKQKLQAESKYCPKIIGLGGVGPRQLKVLRDYGFDGTAVLGAIWNNEFSFVMFLEIMVQLSDL